MQNGDAWNIQASLVVWAPQRWKILKQAMRHPTYGQLREDAKTVSTSYDGLTVNMLAEFRQKEGTRLMMKVKAPDGRITQAGSYLFPIITDEYCSRNAYLYLDMMRLVILVSAQVKATIDQLKIWHDEVKTYFAFHFDED